MSKTHIPPDLTGSDWKEVFKYAKAPEMANPHGQPVNTDPFTREGVLLVKASQEGDREGPDWVCFGKLKDKRWFSFRAGCDYTGWG